MEVTMESIGNRIKNRRKELHLTQTDIKSMCSISSGALSEMENGNRTPSVILFHSLSQALECSMDWLATGESPNPDTLLHSESGVLETQAEAELLNGFRQLDLDDREEILTLLNLKLRRLKRDAEKLEKLSDYGKLSNKLA